MSEEKEEFQHYFVSEPAVPSAPEIIRAQLRARKLSFKTDRGVFSHGSIDFGTRTLAETMKIPPRARVLDLGCGYGVLGIVARLMTPDAKVTMVDVNARACALAAENAETNRAGDVEVVCGDAAETMAVRMFDVILLNPPVHAGRTAVLALFEFAASVLDRDGKLWCVIQTSKGARRYAGDLEQWFDTVETVRMERGYRVFAASGAKAKD